MIANSFADSKDKQGQKTQTFKFFNSALKTKKNFYQNVKNPILELTKKQTRQTLKINIKFLNQSFTSGTFTT